MGVIWKVHADKDIYQNLYRKDDQIKVSQSKLLSLFFSLLDFEILLATPKIDECVFVKVHSHHQ